MGNKRKKLAYGLKDFVPTTVNFSNLKDKFSKESLDFEDSDGNYQVSDDGLSKKRMEDSIEYEEMVAQILCNLEVREKLIFTYQLLRDSGYKIDHGTFAKTVKLSRRQYMRVLEEVRMKSGLFVLGYQGIIKGRKSHKGR